MHAVIDRFVVRALDEEDQAHLLEDYREHGDVGAARFLSGWVLSALRSAGVRVPVSMVEERVVYVLRTHERGRK